MLLTGPGVTPNAGELSLGVRSFAGRDMLAAGSAQGWDRVFQTMIGRGRFGGYVGSFAGTGALTLYPGTSGISSNLSSMGTVTGISAATTNRAARESRSGNISAATAGSFCGWRSSSSGLRTLYVSDGSNGGFFVIVRFVVADPATVSGARMFIGLTTSTGTPTNVNPSSLTNVIGIGQVDGSNNLNIIFGGATNQAPIDLGPNFPANTLTADLYELILHSAPNDATQVGYRVERLNTGDVASGTLANTSPGTTLPAASAGLAPIMWRCNNAAALAVQLDISGFIYFQQ